MLTHAVGGIGRLFIEAAERLGNGPRLSVLIFHRVHAVEDPLFSREITAERFDQMMALVSRGFRVLDLERAARDLAAGRLPSRAIAITFDDGYADNHDIALPILKKHGLPATFFVATGFLDGGRMWNDTVIECLRRCTKRTVDLHSLGLPALSLETPLQRRAAIDRVLPVIKYLPLAQRESALRTVHDACGHPKLPNNLMMTRAQVRALAEAGMSIGAHTVNHPILCKQDDAAAEDEIVRGRADLEAVTGKPVSLFAYPNGRPGQDYVEVHVEMVRRLGFVATASTATGVSRSGDDLHQLRRFTPWYPRPWRWFTALSLHHARN